MRKSETMDKFLDLYDITMLNEDETNCANKTISSNEIKTGITKSPNRNKSLFISFHCRFLSNLQ